MSFLDDLNNAQENKAKREKEEKRKRDEEDQKKLEECLAESYRELKRQMLWEAEEGRKTLSFQLFIRSLKVMRVSIENDKREPKNSGEWFTKKYGEKRLIQSSKGTEYLYSPLFPLSVIRRIENTYKAFLEADGITNVTFEETDLVYTDGDKRWYEKREAPASAYVLYEPKFDVNVSW